MTVCRLDKFISSQLNLPRSACRKLIARGAVTVNGAVLKKPEEKITAETDAVAVNGEEIRYQKYVYIMMNKPKGVLSATTDKNRKTVVDLVPPALFRRDLFPVGRLDRDTTGLLILTDDGDFAHYVISPKSHLKKRYRVLLDAPADASAVKAFRDGITLADGTKCMPAELEISGENPCLVFATIYEGKYHQIKRMFGTLGLGVDELHRVSIGEVSLDENLREGDCRAMKNDEISLIYK